MAYASNDVHNATFLAGNIVYQMTQALLNAKDDEDLDIINDGVMLLDMVTSYFVEQDQVFLKEFAEIKDARKTARIRNEKGELCQYEPGFDKAMDMDFRLREGRAMFRSMCRVGKMSRIDSPSAQWTPAVPE